MIELNEYCRKCQIPFVYTYVMGCTTSIFTDFGSKFTVVEPSSEEVVDVIVHSIDLHKEGTSLVKLLEGTKHQL